MYFWYFYLFKKRNIISIICDNEFLANWNKSSTIESDIGKSNNQKNYVEDLKGMLHLV